MTRPAAHALPSSALHQGPPGQYQLQAAIAAIHDEAPCAADTDWPQIVALYELLLQVSSNPVAALNHAVAVAMARGPRAGLDLLNGLAADQRIVTGHRFHAVRAHLLDMAGDYAAARESYLEAASRAGSLPHQRYLNAQAARLSENSHRPGARLQIGGFIDPPCGWEWPGLLPFAAGSQIRRAPAQPSTSTRPSRCSTSCQAP